MAIVITKAAVRRTLEQWFIAARAGQTLGAVETAKLSSADAAAQSSDYFFDVLAMDEDSFQHEPSMQEDYVHWTKEFLNANPQLWTGMSGSPIEVALQVLEAHVKANEPTKADAVVELVAAVDLPAGTPLVISADGKVAPAPAADSDDLFA